MAKYYPPESFAGTLISTLLQYSLLFATLWTALLLVGWGLGPPLGLQASYAP